MRRARFEWESEAIFGRAPVEADLPAISGFFLSACDLSIARSVLFANDPPAVAYSPAPKGTLSFLSGRDLLLRARSDAPSRQA